MSPQDPKIEVHQIPLADGWKGAIYSTWNFPEEIVAGWNRMCKAYGEIGFFISYGWFENWWQAFGGSGTLQVIVLLKDEDPKAIFPLYKKTVLKKGKQVTSISSLTNDHTYFYDFIIDPRERKEGLFLFWQLAGKLYPNEEIYLEYIPIKGDNLSSSFIQVLQQARTPFQTFGEPWDPRIELSGNIEELEKNLPGRLRNGLKRCRKKADQQGKIRLEIIKQIDCLDDKLDILFSVEYNSWKGLQGTAIKCQKDVEKFYRILAHWSMANDLFLLFILWVGETPVAASFCISSGQTVFLLKLGYQEDFKYLSPGNLLQQEVFKFLFDSPGIKKYHFLGACEPWKMEWTSLTGESGWVRVYPNSFEGWSRYYVKYGWKKPLKKNRIVRGLRDLLEKGQRG